MAKMYLMCGLSGVGKTTYAKKFAAENNLLYLGVDEFYAKVNGDECIHENSFEVWIEYYKAIHEAEINNIDCVIDTNAITHCHREQFLEWFPSFEHHLIFIAASEKLRYENNAKRKRRIPDEAMQNMYAKADLPEYDFLNEKDSEDPKWKSIVYVLNDENNFKEPKKWR